MLNTFKRAVRRAVGCSDRGHILAPERESIYQEIVRRDLARCKVDDVFYPTGWAANYGLFYVILRATLEFPFEEVVELGAGQSTLLLDALARAGALKGNITTVEHSAQWAADIGAKISHKMIKTNLVDKIVDEIPFAGYDFSTLSKDAIDLLIIDGPPGGRDDIRYSRLGALELVSRLRTEGFLVIIDDAERDAEALLARKFHAELVSRGVTCSLSYIVSNKYQAIISGGSYAAAEFY